MKKWMVLVILIAVTATWAWAADYVTLTNENGVFGSNTNPVKVQLTGVTVNSLGDGPIGIGSTDPRASLDVVGTVYAARIKTSVITDNGTNVGVGSSVPEQKLVVNGSAKATAFIGPVTGDVTGNLTGDVTGNVSGTAATVTTAAQPAITSLGALTGLYSSGNVGIGTSVPGTQLAVGTTGQATISSAGNILTSGTLGAGAITGSSVYSSGNVGIGTVVGSSLLSIGATSQMTVTSAGNVSTSGTWAAGATTITGALKASGNIGIGTTLTDSKLQVDPSIYSETQGAGGNRTLCVSADGKIFSTATACP